MEFNLHDVPLKAASSKLTARYQRVILSHLSIKLSLRADVEDFEIISNVQEYEQLGDIVVHLFFKNGEHKVILCCLRHNVNKGKVQDFTDFDKFEKAYNKLTTKPQIYPSDKVTVILYTNCEKTHPENVTAESIEFLETDILSIFYAGKDKKESYKLFNNNDSSFYSNCYLFCNQIKATNGNNVISNDFGDNFGKEISESIEKYFLKTIPKQKEAFNKSQIIFMLRNILINPLISTVEPSEETINKSITNQPLDTFNKFNVSKISENNSRYLMKSIADFIDNNLEKPDLGWEKELPKEMIDKLIKKKELESYMKWTIAYKSFTKKDLWILYCTIRKLPLLLKIDELNHKEIRFILKHFSNDISLILCEDPKTTADQDSNTASLYEECQLNNDINIFNDLSDLKKENSVLLHKILKETKICLYFNPTSLEDIAGKDEQILKTISPDAFVELLCENINLSTVYEKNPHYIKRQVQAKLYSKDIRECGEFVLIADESENIDQSCRAEQTVSTASTVLRDQPFCYFQSFGDKYFCYFTNLKILNPIEKYATDEQINEEDLLKYGKTGCIIIHGPPGIGKTTFLQNLSQHSSCKYLYIYIPIHDMIKSDVNKLFESEESLVDYLSKIMNKWQDLNDFTKIFILRCLKEKRIRLLLDGFDETNANPKIFYRLSKELDVPFTLATRSKKITIIKTALRISSDFRLLELNSDSQKDFISKNCESQESDQIVKKLNEISSLNFLGNPFLITLLIETFKEDKNLDNWNLVDALDKFIETQMNDQCCCIKRKIKKLACSLFFDDDILEQLKIHKQELAEDMADLRQIIKTNAIVSTANASNEIQFTHRLYAEFLCAKYLSDVFINTEKDKLKSYSKIFELLFAEDLIQVRFFFDMLLNRKNPLVTAVLFNDKNKVETILENNQESLSACDELGRTIKHIIMGYGNRYNYPYKVDGLKNIAKLRTYNVLKKNRQFSVNMELLELLLKDNSGYGRDSFGNFPDVYGFFSKSYKFLDYYCKNNKIQSIPNINQNIFFIVDCLDLYLMKIHI